MTIDKCLETLSGRDDETDKTLLLEKRFAFDALKRFPLEEDICERTYYAHEAISSAVDYFRYISRKKKNKAVKNYLRIIRENIPSPDRWETL